MDYVLNFDIIKGVFPLQIPALGRHPDTAEVTRAQGETILMIMAILMRILMMSTKIGDDHDDDGRIGGSSDDDGCDNGCSDGGNCDDDVGRCACGRGAPMEFATTTMAMME